MSRKPREAEIGNHYPTTPLHGCTGEDLLRGSNELNVMLTPDEMFEAIVAALKSDTEYSPDCIEAKFDGQIGMPIKLEGGCPGSADDGWSLKVEYLEWTAANPNYRIERAREP